MNNRCYFEVLVFKRCIWSMDVKGLESLCGLTHVHSVFFTVLKNMIIEVHRAKVCPQSVCNIHRVSATFTECLQHSQSVCTIHRGYATQEFIVLSNNCTDGSINLVPFVPYKWLLPQPFMTHNTAPSSQGKITGATHSITLSEASWVSLPSCRLKTWQRWAPTETGRVRSSWGDPSELFRMHGFKGTNQIWNSSNTFVTKQQWRDFQVKTWLIAGQGSKWCYCERCLPARYRSVRTWTCDDANA